MKIPLLFFLPLFSTHCFAQKTFSIDTSLLQLIDFKKYKTFIVSKDVDINFIGRRISDKDRFTPSKLEAITTDKAIQTQYANAGLRQLDKQHKNISLTSDTTEWKQTYHTYQEQRPTIFQQQLKDQKNKIQKFDRYLWGYHNSDNEKLILIRFDPHKIKHYTIAGETFVDILTIMVYNLNRGTLSYSGWADHAE